MSYHVPVLLQQTVESLLIHEGGIYVDATLGGGGHFSSILSELKRGKAIGIDVDSDAIEKNVCDLLQQGFEKVSKSGSYQFLRKGELEVILAHKNFRHVSEIIGSLCSGSRIDGILFDLGVSSYQIDQPARGFSYMKDAPLDMRMDTELTVQAEDLVNGLYEKELVQVLANYGEEVYAKRIARNIVKERKNGKIVDNKRLKEVIKKSVPF